jgi:protein-tyrosine phosphatase
MTKLRDNLYVSNWQAPREPDYLRQEGITAILNVAFEINDPEYGPGDFKTVKIGITDNDSNDAYIKKMAVDCAKRLLDAGETLLIHCNAGQSRSVYVCTMALAELEGKDHHDIWNEIKKVHPFAMYGPLFHGANAIYYPDAEKEDHEKKDSEAKV